MVSKEFAIELAKRYFPNQRSSDLVAKETYLVGLENVQFIDSSNGSLFVGVVKVVVTGSQPGATMNVQIAPQATKRYEQGQVNTTVLSLFNSDSVEAYPKYFEFDYVGWNLELADSLEGVIITFMGYEVRGN